VRITVLDGGQNAGDFGHEREFTHNYLVSNARSC
jgi:hypothetical protein